jgi:hypothetical protein
MIHSVVDGKKSNMISITNITNTIFLSFLHKIDKKMCDLLGISYDYIYSNIISHNNIKDKIVYLIKILNIDCININDISNKIYCEDTFSNIDNVIDYYFKNDNLSNIKEYCNYFSNRKIYEYSLKLLNPTEDLMTGNNSFSSLLNNYNSLRITIPELEPIIKMDLLLKYNKDFNKINTNNILKTDIEPDKFNYIFYDLCVTNKNLIHAHCCNKVKNLKLRGTKSEPLFIQFIMMSLKHNGKAVVIVPDHFLFNDSIQHTATRQYLCNKFNLISITQIDSRLYYNKNLKYSILYFDYTKPTTEVRFDKLLADCTVELQKNVTCDTIKEFNYILYRNTYINNQPIVATNKDISYSKLSDVYNIYSEASLDINTGIKISKVYKNDKSISLLCNDNINTDNDSYYLIKKTTCNLLDNYLNYYVIYYLQSRLTNYLKLGQNTIDISLINDINIPIISPQYQEIIIKHFKYTNIILDDNLKLISNYNMVKRNFVEMNTLTNSSITINNICDIYSSEEVSLNGSVIGIIRTGLKAGTVYLVDDNKPNTNSYYLSIKNKDFSLTYVFYWLWFNNNRLLELSQMKSQTTLSRANILNFNIPVINENCQKNIVTKCQYYDTMIETISKNSNVLTCDLDNFVWNI